MDIDDDRIRIIDTIIDPQGAGEDGGLKYFKLYYINRHTGCKLYT